MARAMPPPSQLLALPSCWPGGGEGKARAKNCWRRARRRGRGLVKVTEARPSAPRWLSAPDAAVGVVVRRLGLPFSEAAREASERRRGASARAARVM